MGQAGKFKKILERPGIVVAPGVYDCISAKIAAEIGFEALYIGSYASAATLYGAPDTGFLGLSDMLDQVRRISGAVDLPIIADAENGFGNPVHVARTVREFERAGAAAIHLEDHEFGKHIGKNMIILPLPQVVDKIKAAVDARVDREFQIIGRTDTAFSTGLDQALERGVAMAEAGADLIFIAGLALNALARAAKTLPVPLLNAYTDLPGLPGATTMDMESSGLKVVIYFALSHLLAFGAVREGLMLLKQKGSTVNLGDRLINYADFDNFLGIGQVRKLAKKYHVLS
ncbi:MAG: isocitrate lyase/PEP mutase family protein [Bacillota bacterium]